LPQSRKSAEAKGQADYTTITLRKTEYDKLVKFKEELQQRSDYSWISSLGLGAFIGFMIGLAMTAAGRTSLTCGNCGMQINTATWNMSSGHCPNCGKMLFSQMHTRR